MAHLGGGAEAHARLNQYEYRTNSSLVLTPDSPSRDPHDPIRQPPESLYGKIDRKLFGDRAYGGRPRDSDEKLYNRKKDPEDTRDSKRRRVEEESVLTLPEGGVYEPKSKETVAAYEAMLSVIQQQLGGQSLSIVTGAADEILYVLKNDRLKNHEKKKDIEKVLNCISNQLFDQLVSIGRRITDFEDAGDDGKDAVDDSVGVAVEFEDDEDDDVDMVQEAADEEEDDVLDRDENRAMRTDGGLQEANEGVSLNVRDIDAYWLQRKISQEYEQQIDPHQSYELAEEVLKILEDADDDLEVETRLLVHFQFDKFSFVKYLLRNRVKIVWCTRLARAEDENQKKQIEEKMRELGPDLVAILDQLHATRASATEREETIPLKIQREVVDHDAGTGWSNGQPQLLNLENISFNQGGLLMANKTCELPLGSYRTHCKGYEEVHVPALKPKPFADNDKLVKISAMPSWAQMAFAGMTQLNRVQSKVYETALFKPDNILLCAPTGSGKTNVAMLTILQQIGLHMNEDGSFNHSGYKIVYVAPMKALVAEVVGNLSNRLKPYGVTVKELSGDQTLTSQQIEETQIIVTTPEKWDIVTRKSGDLSYTQLVKLIIIDEIHILHDNRGPVIESIVARTVRQIETTKEHIRLVGLSATLPNYDDVALFLRVDLKKGLFYFDNSYRPCPLDQKYIGIKVKKPLQRFQMMNDICYEKVISAAGKHQVLIFVHSRKETTKTASAIRDTALANDTLEIFLKDDGASRAILHEHIGLVKNNDLKDLLPYGFAIHNAGLARADREMVELLFANGHIQVLVSTATLAWGVNLPAHTVIIKGTQVYNPEKGAWTELSPLDVMQMLGRAGRPQYDSYGEGVIITGHSELKYYLSVMNQQLPIESQLVSKLADQLNAEIVLGTVKNVKEAIHWLSYTYLYVRMVRNPTLYGLSSDALKTDQLLEARRADLVHSAATILDKNNLVRYDRKSGYFQATDLGRIASYYYITHGTIATYNEHLKRNMSDIELCRLFSLSEEFKYVTVRRDEKMELVKLLDRVPIPIKEHLEEPSAKINALLQAYISQLKLEGHSLASDMVFITQSAGRLMRALFEIALKKGWAELAEKALNLCKMVNKRIWSVQTPLHQLHCTKNVMMKLEKKDLAWERYYDLSPQELGELVRAPKLGRVLHKRIHEFPKLIISAHVQPITRSILRVELTITPDFHWDDTVHGYVEPFWVIVEDNDGETILHHEHFMLKKQYIDEDHTLEFNLPIHEPLPPQYFIKVVSDRWLGSTSVLPVSFRHMILPQKFPPPTELLDLQPLPVTALKNPLYESLYPEFNHFNPVQTQLFTKLYNTDDNVLVAAPPGSGKSVFAELSILRNHQKGVDDIMRVVYIAPVEALGKKRFNIWKKKFGDGLGLRVCELTGETITDLKLLEKGQVIISTPDKWDALSCRWKQRKLVQQVSLFIVDELHLVGGQNGHVLEVIVSRMRYISQVHNYNTRIIALSASVAPAKDLGEWIGAMSAGIFNFVVRPDPHEKYNKKFLFEAIPVESQLHHQLHDSLNAEVAVKVVADKQEAVDYLTWTFMYRRLTQNPSYYNLQGVSKQHLQEHLSELVENTLNDLESSKCVSVNNDFHLSPSNLGLIASYYYISYTTIEMFSSSLTSKTKLKGILDILSAASEYETLVVRPGEEGLLRKLINHQRFSNKNPNYGDPHVKANVLLQAYLSRQLVGGNLGSDQKQVVLCGVRLVQAMVDVITTNGWLSLALLAMEVSQMLTQGMWEHDSVLLQLPHFTKELAKRCRENQVKSVETVYDLVEMEDDKRRELLQMSDTQLMDVAKFCNRFPNIDLSYEVLNSDDVKVGECFTLVVTLERDVEGATNVGPADAPKVKEEGWWLVVGDTESDEVVANKRVFLQRKLRVKVDNITAPSEPGEKRFTLFFMCDSYMGCDQEYSFTVDVKPASGYDDSGRE